ncbi:uncharacterized protein LOC103934692 [Pyrus x bretschneideri]|uniref:uncharacterized protein LOC103934692 n=1 Tax=Pyrus x bretschneideri TaxID=225117 RepID=UPI00202F5DA5|nr:uncharacterized protein LOC103934692 [Pyrus x bretschneideri]
MPPQTPESGRIRPDHKQMRPTKKPRLAEAEESEAAEAQGSKAAEAQGQKAAEAQVPEAAVEQGPEADDPDEKYWSDSDGSESERYGTCIICWKDDHTVATCPLTYFVPSGVLVSPYAEIVCWCCQEDPEVAHPGEIVAQRAMVKPGV